MATLPPVTEITIRDASAEDISTLAELNAHVQAFHAATEPEIYREASADALAPSVAEYLERDGAFGLLAEVDGRALGYALVCFHRREANALRHGWTFLHVDHLGVAPDQRRRGIGRALMAAVEERARSIGVDSVDLDVRALNDDARAFYRALGYDVTRIYLRRRT